MLYALLKPVVRVALRLYFGRIVCTNLSRIETGGPMIILANHTASFMDAIIVATMVQRRIHFFARGDVFGKPRADRLLRSLGMMPVYRLSEGRDKLHLNDTSNEEALRVLAAGGAVLIFCEGVSNVAKLLKPLKKGPFRLAATAAESKQTAPVLLPLGINYSEPARPFGDAFLIAGNPIDSAVALRDAAGNAARAATELMRRTASALEPIVWHVARPEDFATADGAIRLLKAACPGYSFAQSQRLLRHIASPEGETLSTAISAYRSVQPKDNAHAIAPLAAGEWAALIGGLPLGIWGFAVNLLPIAAAHRITTKKVTEPDFWSPVFVAVSVLCALLYWIVLLLAGSLLHLLLPAMLLVISGTACGVFYLKIFRPLAVRAWAQLRNAGHRDATMQQRQDALLARILAIIATA